MTDYVIYAVATDEDKVIDAIKDGEWYGWPMPAEATADQLTHCMSDGPYKVFEVTIKEY